MQKFLLKGTLVAFVIITYGCGIDPANEFAPPKTTQMEKKYTTKAKEKTVSKKIEISKSAAQYRNINEVVSSGVNDSVLLTNINFVTRWNILGPFPYKAERLNDSKIKSVLHEKLIANEKELTGDETVKTLSTWQLARFESPSKPGEINLRTFFKYKRQNLIAYAVTYLHCKQELSNLTLYTGSSAYIKVWINHHLVHAYDHAKRQGKWDQDVIKNIKLRKGYNLIVVKCVAIEKDWNFYLRFSDNKNAPLKFIPVKELKKTQAKKKKHEN